MGKFISAGIGMMNPYMAINNHDIYRTVYEDDSFTGMENTDASDGLSEEAKEAIAIINNRQDTKEGEEKYNYKETYTDTDMLKNDLALITNYAAYFSDTRVGCNDAINPYWQFGRDDDIVDPRTICQVPLKNKPVLDAMDVAKKYYDQGLGRVYREVYENHQQILWLQAGIPKLTNVATFLQNAGNQRLSDWHCGGLINRIIASLSSAVKWGIGIRMAFRCKYILLWRLYNFIHTNVVNTPTKYFEFVPCPGAYYSTVNTLLECIAENMRIIPDSSSTKRHIKVRKPGNIDGTIDKSNANGDAVVGVPELTFEAGVVPDFLEGGVDIFRMLNRRALQLAAQHTANHKYQAPPPSTSYLINAALFNQKDGFFNAHRQFAFEKDNNKETNIYKMTLDEKNSDFFSGIKASMYGAGDYIGFKIERGVAVSESYSNQTSKPEIANMINEWGSEGRRRTRSFGHSIKGRVAEAFANRMMGDSKSITDGINKYVKDLGTELMFSNANIDLASIIINGDGWVDIPEVWQSSEFGDRSYSIDIKLRARYGDPLSIFQSIYVPMMSLIALTAPRSVGDNAYTSPFLIRAFCRGMFNVPLGIISSLSITRGSESYGWTESFLPTAVDIHMTIKDLSPALYLSLPDRYFSIFGCWNMRKNLNLMAYLDTLSGLSLAESVLYWNRLSRWWEQLLGNMKKDSWLNAQRWRFILGKAIPRELWLGFSGYVGGGNKNQYSGAFGIGVFK